MRLSDYVSSQDVDRAIAVTIDSFVGSQKVSCKKALARAFRQVHTGEAGCWQEDWRRKKLGAWK